MIRSRSATRRVQGLAAAVFAVVLGSCTEPGSDTVKQSWELSDPMVMSMNRGVALMEQYDYAAAAAAFDTAVQIDPESLEARVNLAIATFNRNQKDDIERAAVMLDEVLSDDPDEPRALYLRAIIHQYSGQDTEAIALLERVLKLKPHDAHAWYLLARSRINTGLPAEADLQRAIQENPALVSAYYQLAGAASAAGDQEEAQKYLKLFMQHRQSPLAETVIVPSYGQMGSLAMVRPVKGRPARSVTRGTVTFGAPRALWSDDQQKDAAAPVQHATHDPGIAIADVNADGLLDIALVTDTGKRGGRVRLLLGRPGHKLGDATESSGLGSIESARSCAFGDYDNDNVVDLFVSCDGPNHLMRGLGDGRFTDVAAATGAAGAAVSSVSAIFLDADHDADLDIYVCNDSSADGSRPAANQLLNNNADGTFTDIAAEAGVQCADQHSVGAYPADVDDDRDTDLIVFHRDGPMTVLLNDRFGRYHAGAITPDPIRGGHGGVAQDFNGDGRADLLLFPTPTDPARLLLSDASMVRTHSEAFDRAYASLNTWDKPRSARISDVDLDGDLDIVVMGQNGHLLLNDGWGRFVSQANVWRRRSNAPAIATALADMTGDGLADLLYTDGRRVELTPAKLSPPANWLTVTPTGDRGTDKRTRSPASGYGTRLALRSGRHEQVITYTGLEAGPSQSQIPLTIGINGADHADYLTLRWPDGVRQTETSLATATNHRIREMERRISSCPVLFTYNGDGFEFVGDFAGVGGLGYFVSVDESAPPEVLEHVKIEGRQLQPIDGYYLLRVCEPMEEVAYIDRLELLAVDHPVGSEVWPDERLVISGPPATHRLLHITNRIFPVSAQAPNGQPCADRLAEVDRYYAYTPDLDARFIGFAQPHTLDVDFGDRLTDIGTDQRVFLFVNASIEYPYSQTTYAAQQASMDWQPIRIDLMGDDGQWHTIVPDAGAPGGIGRTITIELTGKLPTGPCRLRLTTNLEIYYDQLFIAVDRGTGALNIQTAPMAEAKLHRLGFPQEYSPDGQHPTIYTYDRIDETNSFRVPRGRYTRYGPVAELLTEFDDRYVVVGSGDEIALRFDARAVPGPAEGMRRSFILVSHAYCKDMDLATACPDTVTPLPFQGMSAYPYPDDEQRPVRPDVEAYQRQYNTRELP